MRSIRGSDIRATDEESEWSSHRFSGSSSPLSAADELHERVNERVEDVDDLGIEQLERGKVVARLERKIKKQEEKYSRVSLEAVG